MFTIVASRPDAQIVGATGADAVEVAAAAFEPDFRRKLRSNRRPSALCGHSIAAYCGASPTPGAAYHINAWCLDGRSPAAVIEDFMNSDEFKNLNAAK